MRCRQRRRPAYARKSVSRCSYFIFCVARSICTGLSSDPIFYVSYYSPVLHRSSPLRHRVCLFICLANDIGYIGVVFSNLPMSNHYRQRKPESIASSPIKTEQHTERSARVRTSNKPPTSQKMKSLVINSVEETKILHFGRHSNQRRLAHNWKVPFVFIPCQPARSITGQCLQ